MAVLVADTFNRANSDTVGTGWEEEAGDWDIASNGVIQTDAGSTPGCLRNTTDMGSAAHWVEARTDASDGSGQIGVVLRLDTTVFTCLSVEVADGAFKLLRVTNGTPDTDVSVGPAHTHAPGMVYAADVDGSGTVRVYLNGILQHTWSSQSHAAGNELTGLHINESASGVVRFGRFRAGDGAYPGPDHPTWVAIGVRGAGTTTTTPTLAGGAAGRLAVAHRAIKPNTATATAEAGWTQRLNVTGGSGTTGVDVGLTRLSVDTDELAGGEGNPTFDQASTPNSVTSSICTYAKPSGSTWDIAVTSGDDTGHGTGRAATGAAALALAPGDVVLAICGSDTDATNAFTSPAITASGITFSSTIARLAPGGSGTGNDVGSHVWEALVEDGTVTVAPSLSLTGAVANCGPVGFVRLRAASGSLAATVDPAVVLLAGVDPTAAGSGAASRPADPAVVALTGLTPVASGTGTAAAAVDPAALAVAGTDPVASGSGQAARAVDPAAVTVSGVTPVSSGSGSALAAVDPAVITISGVTPGAAGSGVAARAVDVAVVVLGGIDVAVTAGTTVQVDPAALVLSGVDLTAAGSGAAAVTIDVAQLALVGADVAAGSGATVIVADTATLTLSAVDAALAGSGAAARAVDTAVLTLTGVDTSAGTGPGESTPPFRASALTRRTTVITRHPTPTAGLRRLVEVTGAAHTIEAETP